MSAYCCATGQTMPAAISTGATKSGGLVRTSSGGCSSSSTVDATVTGKRPRLGAGHDDGLGAPGGDGCQGVVDDLLLGDADLAQHGARPG